MGERSTTLLAYGYLSAILATIFWSGNIVVARGLTESVPPVSLAFWRWTIAILVFLPFALKSVVSDWAHIKRHWIYLSITSILGISLFNTLIYIAGHTATAINLALIAITSPVFIIILTRVIYGEPITIFKWLGISLVISGVVALVTEGDLSLLLTLEFARGDLWMLLAAAIFAIYSLLIKRKPEKVGSLSLQFSTFFLGVLFLAPFYAWETLETGFQIQQISRNTLYLLLYLAVFASLIAFVLWGKAIDAIGPSRSAMIYYMLPVFSGLSAYFFLGESIGVIHLVSTLLIVSGVLTALHQPASLHSPG